MSENLETRFEQPATKEDLAKIEVLIWRTLWLQNVFIVVTFGTVLLYLVSYR